MYTLLKTSNWNSTSPHFDTVWFIGMTVSSTFITIQWHQTNTEISFVMCFSVTEIYKTPQVHELVLLWLSLIHLHAFEYGWDSKRACCFFALCAERASTAVRETAVSSDRVRVLLLRGSIKYKRDFRNWCEIC